MAASIGSSSVIESGSLVWLDSLEPITIGLSGMRVQLLFETVEGEGFSTSVEMAGPVARLRMVNPDPARGSVHDAAINIFGRSVRFLYTAIPAGATGVWLISYTAFEG